MCTQGHKLPKSMLSKNLSAHVQTWIKVLKTFGPKFEQTTRRLRKQDEILALDECCKGMTAKWDMFDEFRPRALKTADFGSAQNTIQNSIIMSFDVFFSVINILKSQASNTKTIFALLNSGCQFGHKNRKCSKNNRHSAPRNLSFNGVWVHIHNSCQGHKLRQSV